MLIFFSQAEDGIRDLTVTGVQTCALPIFDEVGSAVTSVKPGQFVIGSFFASDNTCPNCQAGYQSSCQHKRSEEHTSELQSQSNLVCRLLLEKKKKKKKETIYSNTDTRTH